MAPLRDQYRHMMDRRYFDNHFFVGPDMPDPIRPAELARLIRKYVLFFPVYDSFIQIAKGERLRFAELIDRANDWLEADGGEGSKPGRAAVPNTRVDLEWAVEAEI